VLFVLNWLLQFHISKRHAKTKRAKHGGDYEMMADIEDDDGVPSVIGEFEQRKGCWSVFLLLHFLRKYELFRRF
jgi:hypothetical protein